MSSEPDSAGEPHFDEAGAPFVTTEQGDRVLAPPAFARAPTPGAIVDVRNVRKVYVHNDKPLAVLKGVSLSIQPGEVLSIVGPSGAGKSTLLHLIGALDVPTSGTIRIAGVNITDLPGHRLAALRNETIGFVFQFHHLLPEFTALENVMMPGLIQGKHSRARLAEMAIELLREVNLEHRATHRPSELSGGEQQRVALARALVLTPKLLLADEPTGNLDSANSGMMHELFFKLNESHGTTTVIVTHNENLAAQVPRVIKMRDGNIEADGPQSVPPRPAIAETAEAPAG